jgi:hypothetical protein
MRGSPPWGKKMHDNYGIQIRFCAYPMASTCGLENAVARTKYRAQ